MSTKNPPQVVTTPGTARERILNIMYHKSNLPSMGDAQMRPPEAYCVRCQGELWGRDTEPDEFGHTMCPECREELTPKHDPETVSAVLEAYDLEVKKYLSEDICNKIWNELIRRFPEAG